ncbi:hypothetical protein AAHA92_11517 [Salvia divinorum]|uniref:Uncharacterized protein n=1 Tax=Salvia divinorum TaxID=28513 RepID=A0ABD1HHX5_SALDI
MHIGSVPSGNPTLTIGIINEKWLLWSWESWEIRKQLHWNFGGFGLAFEAFLRYTTKAKVVCVIVINVKDDSKAYTDKKGGRD